MLLELSKRTASALSRKIDLISIFRYPTIRAFATYLAEMTDANEAFASGARRGERRRFAAQLRGASVSNRGLA
jgi:hypothetical protein